MKIKAKASWHLLVMVLLVPGMSNGWAQGAACPEPIPGRLFANGFELRDPDFTSPGPFATQTASGTVMRGQRSIPWSAHLPQGAGAPWPWVVFFPGASIPIAAYTSLGQHLASHGFVVVRAAPVFNLLNADHVAMADDARAVVDALSQPDALPVAVDSTRTALAGHSLGGKIAFMAASGDVRVVAVLALDPVNGYDGNAARPSIVPQPTASLTVPIGIFGETTDSAGAIACAPAAINYQTIYDAALATQRGYEWTIDGASHTDFVSDPASCGIACILCVSPTLSPDLTRAFVRGASTAFLETHLRPGPERCRWLTGPDVPSFVTIRSRVAQ